MRVIVLAQHLTRMSRVRFRHHKFYEDIYKTRNNKNNSHRFFLLVIIFYLYEFNLTPITFLRRLTTHKVVKINLHKKILSRKKNVVQFPPPISPYGASTHARDTDYSEILHSIPFCCKQLGFQNYYFRIL